MTQELRDGQLNVRYGLESIDVPYKTSSWSLPRYSGRKCVRCGNPIDLSREVDICGICVKCHDITSIHYVGLYHHDNDDDLHKGIISLKYGNGFWAKVLGMSMALVMLNEAPSLVEGSLLIAVPSHDDDHEDRDYNPPDLLARSVATFTALMYRPHMLEKSRVNHQKDHPTMDQRYRAVEGLYSATEDIDGQVVVLVDDVLTSGATLSACAEALLIDGADSVHVAVEGRNFKLDEDLSYE